jgi:hypothetical protein
MRLRVTPDEIAAGHCVALSRQRSWRTRTGYAVGERESEQMP